MRVLITGGAGFVGSNTADTLLKKGYEVTILDNLSRKGTEKNLEWLKNNHKDLEFMKADVRDFDVMKSACMDKDLIFHLAAQVAVTTSIKNPKDDFDINALGTFNVLEAARLSKSNPIVVYSSTNKVYGNNVNLIPLKISNTRYEFDDPNFENGVPETLSTDANEHTPYGSSKYMADLYTRDFAAVYGMNTISFRMSCVYGTRQFGNEDQGWIAHFVISSILARPLIVFGDGKQVRDVLFIDDLLDALLLATDNIKKTRGQAYNIGGGINNTISLLELIDLLKKSIGKNILYSFSDWRPFDQKVYISDIRKAKQDFGWEPKISAEEGIKKLIGWVGENIDIIR